MIREMLEYCLTPASFHARKTGYLYEAVAFESRARRNKKYWQPHWKTCQGIVQKFCEAHPRSESVAIFGSGCLFEIPKEELAGKYKKIVLVDQVFPRSVRNWAKVQKIEIDFCECDLSVRFPADLKVDLAMSSNLLSQLSLPIPLRKKEIEEKHLYDLRSLKIPTLLWTDTEKVFRRRNSKDIIDTLPTVLTELKNPIANWNWDLALAPEWDREIDVILRMTAVVL